MALIGLFFIPIGTAPPQASPQNPIPLKEKWDMYSRTYDIGNMNRKAVLSIHPLNFFDAYSNEWMPINKNFQHKNKTIGVDTYAYIIENGTYSSYFGETFDSPKAKLYINNYSNWFYITPQNIKCFDDAGNEEIIGSKTNSTAIVTSNNITYPTAFGNFSMDFFYHSSQLESRVKINDATNLIGCTLPYFALFEKFSKNDSVKVIIDGNEWDENSKVITSNAIIFQHNATMNGDNMTDWILPKPVAFTKDTQINGQYQVKKIGQDFAITKYVNTTQLLLMAFPAWLDPTISTNLSGSKFIITDFTVNQTNVNSAYTTDPITNVRTIFLGTSTQRTYQRWNASVTLKNTINITSAILEIELADSLALVGANINVSIYEVFSANNKFNNTWATWNTQPCGTSGTTFNASCNTTAYDSYFLPSGFNVTVNTRINFTITEIVNRSLIDTPKGVFAIVGNTSDNNTFLSSYPFYSAEGGGDNEPQLYLSYGDNDVPLIVNYTAKPSSQLCCKAINFTANLTDADDGLKSSIFAHNFNANVTNTFQDTSLPVTSKHAFGGCTMIADSFTLLSGGAANKYILNVTAKLSTRLATNPQPNFEIWSNSPTGNPLKIIQSLYMNISGLPLVTGTSTKGTHFNLTENNTIILPAGTYWSVLNGSQASSTLAYDFYYRATGLAGDSYKYSTNCGNKWTTVTGRQTSFIERLGLFPLVNVSVRAQSGLVDTAYFNHSPSWVGKFNDYVCANDTGDLVGCSFFANYTILNFTDTIPPTVNFVSPPNNSALNGNVTLRFTAVDNGGVKYVEVQRSENTTTNFAFFANASQVQQGIWETIWNTHLFNNATGASHNFRAVAVDESSNAANSSYGNFTIDRNAPLATNITVVYPFSYTNWTKYGLKNLTIFVTASDEDNGVANVTINSTLFNFTGFNFAKNLTPKPTTANRKQLSNWSLNYTIHRNNTGYQLPVQINITDNATPTRNSLLYAIAFVNIDTNSTQPFNCARNLTFVNIGDDVGFHCDFQDGDDFPNLESGVSYFRLEHNFTGTLKNESWQGLNNKTRNTGLQNFTFTNSGSMLWRMWLNDSIGNVNVSANQYLNVSGDGVAPVVTIMRPVNNSFINISTFNITYNVTDSSAYRECRLFLGGILNNTNQTAVVNATENNITALALEDGVYNDVEVQCEDIYGNVGASSQFTYTIDTTLPQINLNEPKNTTYNLSVVTLNYTLNETNPDTCVRELNSINTTILSCANQTMDETLLGERSHRLVLWVNDSGGNRNSSTIIFTFRHTLLSNATANKTSYIRGENINVSGVFKWDNQTTIQGNSVNITIKWLNTTNSTQREINFTPQTAGNFWDNFSLGANVPTGTWYVNITMFASQNQTNRTSSNITSFIVNGNFTANINDNFVFILQQIRTFIGRKIINNYDIFISAINEISSFSRQAANLFVFTELKNKAAIKNRKVTDTPVFADSSKKTDIFSKAFSDMEILMNSIVRQYTGSRSKSDYNVFADSINRRLRTEKKDADIAIFADNSRRNIALSRRAIDLEILSVNIIRQLISLRIIPNFGIFNEDASRKLRTEKKDTDIEIFTDSKLKTFRAERKNNDIIAFLDYIQFLYNKFFRSQGGGGGNIEGKRLLVLDKTSIETLSYVGGQTRISATNIGDVHIFVNVSIGSLPLIISHSFPFELKPNETEILNMTFVGSENKTYVDYIIFTDDAGEKIKVLYVSLFLESLKTNTTFEKFLLSIDNTDAINALSALGEGATTEYLFTFDNATLNFMPKAIASIIMLFTIFIISQRRDKNGNKLKIGLKWWIMIAVIIAFIVMILPVTHVVDTSATDKSATGVVFAYVNPPNSSVVALPCGMTLHTSAIEIPSAVGASSAIYIGNSCNDAPIFINVQNTDVLPIHISEHLIKLPANKTSAITVTYAGSEKEDHIGHITFQSFYEIGKIEDIQQVEFRSWRTIEDINATAFGVFLINLEKANINGMGKAILEGAFLENFALGIPKIVFTGLVIILLMTIFKIQNIKISKKIWILIMFIIVFIAMIVPTLS